MAGETFASAFPMGFVETQQLAFVSRGPSCANRHTVHPTVDKSAVKATQRASIPRVSGAEALSSLAGACLAGAGLHARTTQLAKKQRRKRERVMRHSAANHTMASAQLGPTYEKPGNQELTFMNDAGYLPDGSSLATAGNNFFRPGSVDPHVDGSPLPKSYYVNDVGYLPDGSSLATAGNNFFRPGSVDPHMEGSPLPPPLKGFCNSAGYLPDGTPLELAGNLMLKVPPGQVAGARAPSRPTPQAQVGGAAAKQPEALSIFHAPLSYFALNLLTPKGPRKNPDVGEPADATRPLGKVGTAAAGSWSCTYGGWDSPARRTTSEVFYVMSGSGCVTDTDGTKHEFGPNDTVILPKNWSGRWDVFSTIHKVWCVHDHPDFEAPLPIRAVVAPLASFTQPPQSTPQATSMQKAYDAPNMSAGCWTCSPGSFAVPQKQSTEWLHVLEGVFFLTGADGSAKRCVAGDSVLTPEGWSGHLDIVEPVKAISVVIAS